MTAGPGPAGVAPRVLCVVLVVAVLAQMFVAAGEAAAQTPPTIPAPTVSQVGTGDKGLTVAWTAPTEIDVMTITAYDIRYIDSAATDKSDARWRVLDNAWTSGELQAIVAGLTNGTAYDIGVRAVVGENDGVWSTARSGTPQDPGNTRQAALLVDGLLPIRGVIDGSESDWYKVTLPTRTDVDIVLSPVSSATIRLHHSGVFAIGIYPDPGIDGSQRLGGISPPGTMFVEVDHDGFGPATVRNYTLHMQLTPNLDLHGATTVQLGVPASGEIREGSPPHSTDGEVDHFRFDLPSAKTVFISLSGTLIQRHLPRHIEQHRLHRPPLSRQHSPLLPLHPHPTNHHHHHPHHRQPLHLQRHPQQRMGHHTQSHLPTPHQHPPTKRRTPTRRPTHHNPRTTPRNLHRRSHRNRQLHHHHHTPINTPRPKTPTTTSPPPPAKSHRVLPTHQVGQATQYRWSPGIRV